jgi:flagellar motor switch protein FliN
MTDESASQEEPQNPEAAIDAATDTVEEPQNSEAATDAATDTVEEPQNPEAAIDAATDAVEKPQNLEAAIDAATDAVAVQARELDELSPDGVSGEPIGLDNILEVPVRVTVEIGRSRMSLGELVRLGPGSLVTLDREAHEPADILVNGKVVARGEIVTIDNAYGVRITSVSKED